MKIKIRVNKEPLEEYLNNLIHEMQTNDSDLALELFRQDLSHRAIWIQPSNNVSKLIDLDLALDSDLDEWQLSLTLNPVNVHEKRMEIINRFDKNPRDLRDESNWKK